MRFRGECMNVIEALYQSILAGNERDATAFTRLALEQGISVQEIVSTGMNSAMEKVGLLFSNNEIFLPEMMVAARAMKAGMKALEPYIMKGESENKGKIILGTIKDDLHDVGKNMVGMMFKGAGFTVVDLGVDVSKERFLESIQKESPDLVGISALLTTVLPNVAEALDFLRGEGSDRLCKILVGGAPVTASFALEVKADGYAPDAGLAIQVGKDLLRRR